MPTRNFPFECDWTEHRSSELDKHTEREFFEHVLDKEREIIRLIKATPAQSASGGINWKVDSIAGQNDRSTHVAFSLKDSEQVSVTASGVDAKGQPTTGTIAFTVDDASVLAVTDNGDGTASLVAGNEGPAILTATDTDADGNAVTSTIEIDVVAGDTASVAFNFGTPEPQAPTA